MAARRQRALVDIVQKYVEAGRTKLPVYDRVSHRLQSMLQDHQFDIEAVERLVQADASLASSLLRLSNSSFFGGLEKVLTVRDAIMRVGVKQVANLVILSSQRQNFKLADQQLQKLSDRLWRHTVGCALGTQWLAERLRLDEVIPNAFLAGLLHDLGKLFLLRVVDDIMHSKHYHFRPSEHLVLEILTRMHPTQGYELMKKWNLPDLYADVVLNHHEEDFDERDLLLASVRLVNRACNRLGVGLGEDIEEDLSTSLEAQSLNAGDLLIAELEIKLEDAMHLSDRED